MDYALQLSDSLFPMGATEEDRDAVLPRERTPAPEHAHKMAEAEAKTYHQLPESLNRPVKPESAHVRPAKPRACTRHVGPRLSPRPRWPPRLRIRLFGQDRYTSVVGPTTGFGASSSGSPSPLHPRRLAESASTAEPTLRPRSSQSPAPEPAPSQELAESAPEPAPSQELAESAPEPAPSQELAESAPEPAPSQELAESAPEPAPSQELAESAPEPAPSQELAESAPEPAPSQELAESAQRPLRSRSSQSPVLRVPSWFRPVPQSPCWPCPAHLRLRWSRQLSFVSAGPAQLSFVSAGPAQLSFVSAGPAQLDNASAGSVQFCRAPKRFSTSRVHPRGGGVHQELSWRELPSIAHGDPGPAMAHEVP